MLALSVTDGGAASRSSAAISARHFSSAAWAGSRKLMIHKAVKLEQTMTDNFLCLDRVRIVFSIDRTPLSGRRRVIPGSQLDRPLEGSAAHSLSIVPVRSEAATRQFGLLVAASYAIH